MKVKMVRIGNSKGIRLPQSIIRQCGFGDVIEMRVGDGVVVLAPTRNRREGWDAAFEAMATADDDTPFVPNGIAHEWDEEEWEWQRKLAASIFGSCISTRYKVRKFRIRARPTSSHSTK